MVDLARNPGWPRLMRAETAARYLDISKNQFRVEVESGIWPRPIRRGRVICWDRRALDTAADRLSGVKMPTPFISAEDVLREWEP